MGILDDVFSVACIKTSVGVGTRNRGVVLEGPHGAVEIFSPESASVDVSLVLEIFLQLDGACHHIIDAVDVYRSLVIHASPQLLIACWFPVCRFS